MVKERLDFLMVLLILFLVMIYEPRITFNQGLIITDDIFASDLMNDRYPVRVELGRQIKKGKIPLWTDLIYNGFPLQANPESGITYPLNLILFRIFSPAQALNISILLKFFLSAFFLYIFLRMIRIDPFASLFGAVAFSWCGFFVVHLKHLNMHDAGIWLPLLLILIEKYKNSSRPTWVLLISFVLGLQILAGHPQISYYTVLFLIIYFLWQKLPDAKEMVGRVRLVVICGLMIILGLGLGMIQLLPGKELTDLSERSGGVTYQFATQYPYYLPDLLTFIFPYINGDPGQGTYVKPGIFWEDYGYVGLLPLFFAFYAMVKTIKKNRYTRFWTLTLIISLILMLGDQAVLYKFLFYILPGMNYFRFSTRFILFVDLSLSIL
ncbi:MAG: YfhO family protein, partial [candidate division WOR-3 bacterium]